MPTAQNEFKVGQKVRVINQAGQSSGGGAGGLSSTKKSLGAHAGAVAGQFLGGVAGGLAAASASANPKSAVAGASKPAELGEIVEVTGSGTYRVKFEDGHQSIVTPGPNCRLEPREN